MGDQASRKHRLEDDNANALICFEGLQDGQKRARKGVERTGFTADTDLETGKSASSTSGSTGAIASAVAVTASSAATIAARLPIVLVSVGGGPYSDVAMSLGAIREMRRMALLIALSESKGFEGKLKGVAMDECHVFVITSTAKKPADGVRGTEVETTDTFGDLIAKDLPAGTNVFIRVELPQGHTAGAMAGTIPFDAQRGIDAAVWAQLANNAQAAAARTSAARQRLAATAVLHDGSANLTVADAASLGVTVLLQDGSGAVNLGLFDVPPIEETIVRGPKGFNLAVAHKLFVDEQRATLVNEFLTAMSANQSLHSNFGVLLSGPNGVGKSAVGVEAFLSCFAKGLPIVYIPTASAWVTAAMNGRGDAFFFRALIAQNADLIAADPVLRETLMPALQDGPSDAFQMEALQTALLAHPDKRVAVIVDEVQTITHAIASGEQAGAIPAERTARAYFQQWQNWDNANTVFVRMDIASSHGARELKLPSGEEHRLRVIKPWTANVVTAAISQPASPAYIGNQYRSLRERIAFIAGGIPRTLFRGKELVVEFANRMTDQESLATHVENELTVVMRECCARWFDGLDASAKAAAVQAMLPLVRGELRWDRVKGLYDDGLVARCHDTAATVTPVSAVAASVIFNVLAGHQRQHMRPLEDVEAGAERGFELERQTLACLEVSRWVLPTKHFNGGAAPAISARADYALVFSSVAADVKAHATLATLYIPTSTQFACAAITVPAGSDEAAPIVVWETSVTDPRDPHRVQKCLRWFASGTNTNIVIQLRNAHSRRPIVCALCWNGDMLADGTFKHKELAEAAARMSAPIPTGQAGAAPPVTVVVVDRAGLQRLGVLA